MAELENPQLDLDVTSSSPVLTAAGITKMLSRLVAPIDKIAITIIIINLLWLNIYYSEAGLDEDDSFGTPPDSPDIKIRLPHEIEFELQELEETDDFIKKNQESIAKSAGK